MCDWLQHLPSRNVFSYFYTWSELNVYRNLAAPVAIPTVNLVFLKLPTLGFQRWLYFSRNTIHHCGHSSQFHYTGLETHDWLLRFFGVVWSAKHSESNGKLLSIKLPSQQYPSLDGITWFFCNFCFIRWSSAVRRPALKEFSDVVFPCLARRFWRIFLCLWVVTEEFSYVFELSYTVQLKAQLVLHLFLNHICKDDKSNGNRICWLFIIAAFLIICQRS